MTENIIKQAQNIWSMLDDMATNDPENYKKFIAKNLNEKPDFLIQPKEHMCIETIVDGTNSENDEPLFINIMEWSSIPDSHKDEDPISICGGIIYKVKENGKAVKITSVAFNPEILIKYGKNSKNIDGKNMLIFMALEFLENFNNIKLKKTFKLLIENIKGHISMAAANIFSSIKKKNDLQEKSFIENDLLTNIKSSLKSGTLTDQFEDLNITPIGSNKLQLSKPLIEELSTEDFNANDDYESVDDIDFSNFATPNYSMKNLSNERLKIDIDLPGVFNVHECILDVGPDDFVLIVKDKYYLNIKFENEVSIHNVEASFSKKCSQLTVYIPVLIII